MISQIQVQKKLNQEWAWECNMNYKIVDNIEEYIDDIITLDDSMKESDSIVDDFKLEDIIPFGDEIYLTINSIVILKEHQDGEVIKLINDEFLKKINNLSIKGINTIAISEDGNKWAKEVGFKHCKKLEDNTDLYIMEF